MRRAFSALHGDSPENRVPAARSAHPGGRIATCSLWDGRVGGRTLRGRLFSKNQAIGMARHPGGGAEPVVARFVRDLHETCSLVSGVQWGRCFAGMQEGSKGSSRVQSRPRYAPTLQRSNACFRAGTMSPRGTNSWPT